ncbi:MAG: OmpA family protein [Candidatus Krumholzibacteriia bacterium]
MIAGAKKKSMFLTLAVVLGILLIAFAGCSKKPAPETETVMPEVTQPSDTIQAPVQPEPVDPNANAIDYPGMDPSEYGVKDVFFAFDEYDLDDKALAVLSENARVLKEANVLVLISGHCDERGTVEYNLALGEKRAKAVRDHLVNLGVPSGKLLVTSYGENKPFVQGHGESAWAQNRRAHFERP